MSRGEVANETGFLPWLGRGMAVCRKDPGSVEFRTMFTVLAHVCCTVMVTVVLLSAAFCLTPALRRHCLITFFSAMAGLPHVQEEETGTPRA